MDAFEVHRQLIQDYRSFTEGFVDIRDRRIRDEVERQSVRGKQWPDPWLSLNPSFAPGDTVASLVQQGTLHAGCQSIFADKRNPGRPRPIALYQHQREAIETARTGESYVLTTGTGSGKSLAYMVPIVDRVLRAGSGKGIKAIVVYPMNALANSQVEELNKFLQEGFAKRPVTYERYTGQDSHEDKQRILQNPPDVLLTNYVMLELMLTRPDERKLLQRHARDLEFLVLDELHTYRGRQGADVAMLVRRVRDLCQAHETLQCVGTSATMSSGTTIAEQKDDVARVAARIFGTEVTPANVIVETLQRATTTRAQTDALLSAAVRERGGAEMSWTPSFQTLRRDHLAAWIEETFGIDSEPGTGRLVRRPPRTVQDAATLLAGLLELTEQSCANAIRATLLAGSRVRDEETNRPLFAFRLHQFLSKGSSIFATLEGPEAREILTEFQTVVGLDEKGVFPLAFCRECGQEYLMAVRKDTSSGPRFAARHQLRPGEQGEGYLFVSDTHQWPFDPVAEDRLPDSWKSTSGANTVIEARRKDVPARYVVSPDGYATLQREGEDQAAGTTVAAWVPGTFRFCLHCGVTYEALRTSDFAKLVTLDQEGRSSAVSVIASSILRALRNVPIEDLPREARKLLTFVDNRQDASLQAGHFNDYAQVVQLRAALYRALTTAGEEGLDPVDQLGLAVVRALALEPADYAQAPHALDLRPAQRALRLVVEHRVLRDLQKGFRVTLPNLEQTGLLRVDYPAAPTLAAREDLWAKAHPALRELDSGQRVEVITVLLDEMRRVLAIEAEGLGQENTESIVRLSSAHLTGVLPLTDTDVSPAGLATAEVGQKGGFRNVVSLTGRSAFGRWLRRTHLGVAKPAEADDVIHSLLGVLQHHGLIASVVEGKQAGYRVRISAMLLRAGSGQAGAPDPVRRTFEAEQAPRVVGFFRDLYQDAGHQLGGMVAREHTAQVRADTREEREHAFREGNLPLLFCSPTMELGVDIASLNVVGLRNVPPTPANYAQRSGRAGRSGQPALVVTYCASGNSHDRYYFERSDRMVSGKVDPPRLDLANEDLVRSHVHAIWLGEALAGTARGLDRSMANVLELAEPEHPVGVELVEVLQDAQSRARAEGTARALFKPMAGELADASWWSDSWVADVLERAFPEFDRACQRWRDLYDAADGELQAAHALISDVTKSRADRDEAERRYREARQRIELLRNDSDGGQSDFYTYGYLASEGFLPGYSFPRLPLAAFIPGRKGQEGGSWLQRARFLAISEFGPNSLIYHEGARYQVTRISLPRGGGQDPQVVRSEAKICMECGYHHRELTLEICEHCGEPLTTKWRDLIQLQTVITRRRERISADEEERNRVGFELATTYRFVPRGSHPGVVEATIVAHNGSALATLSYGDAAEIRVTNLGRRRRVNQDVHGFWLDLTKGQWLSETKGAEEPAAGEDGFEAQAQDVENKARVTPFVEDRRNIAVLRWAGARDEDEAATLQFAIERGIEVAFQLEDSELASAQLPDEAGHGRTLFIESAEGGAGVLRRLQSDPTAVARVAREALTLLHVDPDTGGEVEGACIRGCYRCLLSYSNQLKHELIDRRTAIPSLLDIAGGTSVPVERGPSVTSTAPDTTLNGPAGRLALLLAQHGLRQPDETGVERAGVTVDLLFEGAVATAVVVDDREPPPDLTGLTFAGFHVIRLDSSTDLAALVTAHPGVFGTPDRPLTTSTGGDTA